MARVKLVRTPVPEHLAAQLARRYAPIVQRCLDIASSSASGSLDLTGMLLSIYLQGVVDGTQVAPQLEDLGTCHLREES